MNSSVVATKLRVPGTPSMPVDRLDARLEQVWSHRLGLVIAPAGSGKTTLLSRFALRSPGPVGWYRAEGWDRDEQALLAHVEAALAPALNGAPRGWENVADAANALETWHGERLLLVIDDLHTLQGTAAEQALERLIDYAPPALVFLAASRVPPSFNLPRMRVSGSLLELTGDDLRFRSWEVERLFHDFYGEPLPPEELARLARRTEGWAAGLQLFHLATRGRTPDERRRLLGELGSSSRFTRDYLTRNVLHQLPDDLRRFLLDTSVLGRLSGPLCDRLLGRKGSAEVLADLEHRRLFTQPLPDDGEYRYHEVLRSYLQAALLDELGEEGLHERFRQAAAVLIGAGAAPEALEAYCRGEDWESARRLLASQGAAVAQGSHAWVDTLPATVLHDPWLLLTSARRLRADGRFRDAMDRYQRAEAAFGSADPAALCREERQGLAIWLEGSSSVHPASFALLRTAVKRDPSSVAAAAQKLRVPADSLVAGLAELLAGNVASARRELLHAAQRPEASASAQVVAGLGAGVAGLLMGQRQATVEIEGAVSAAEAVGLDWLARLGRASLALTGSAQSLREAEGVAVTSAAIGDTWGESIARLCMGWGGLLARTDVSNGDALVGQLRALDAPVLEAWARGIVALAEVRGGEPDSRDGASRAEAVARSTGANAARLLAHLALAEESEDPMEADEYLDMALAIARETGIQPPAIREVVADRYSAAGEVDFAPPISIRVLGGFELRLSGREVDLTGVRPRARALLRLLCMNAGTRVHHETIESALWPDADSQASARNLHVAIAALRRAVEPAAVRRSFQLLRRDGDAYLLDVPMGGEVDIVRFERAVANGRLSRERGDPTAAAAAFQAALDWYGGDLLPEDGPAEWATDRREACRLAAVEATQALAEILLAQGEAAGAARACTMGLRIERYHDPLWRLLIQARDQAGDQGAASRARVGYDRMLAELGIEKGAASSSPL